MQGNFLEPSLSPRAADPHWRTVARFSELGLSQRATSCVTRRGGTRPVSTHDCAAAAQATKSPPQVLRSRRNQPNSRPCVAPRMPTPAVPTAPSCPPQPCPADGTAPPQGPQDMTIDFVSHAARNAFRSERASISMRMAQRMKKEPVYLDAVKSARFILAYLPDGRLLLVKGNTRIAALERFGEVRRSPGDPLPCVVLEFDTELLAAKHCGNIQLVGQAFQRSNSYLDAHEVGLRVLELAVANAEKAHRVYDYDATKQKGLGTEFVEKTKISNAFGQNTMSHRAILKGDRVAKDALQKIYADARVEEDTLVRNEEDWAARTRVYTRSNVEHFLKLRAADEIDGALELFRSKHGGNLTLNELKEAFPATQPQTRPKRTAAQPTCVGQDGGCRRPKKRNPAAVAEEQEFSAADGSGAAGEGQLPPAAAEEQPAQHAAAAESAAADGSPADGTLITNTSPTLESPTMLHTGVLGTGEVPPVAAGELPATGTGATRTDTVEPSDAAGVPPAGAATLQAPPASAGGVPPADAWTLHGGGGAGPASVTLHQSEQGAQAAADEVRIQTPPQVPVNRDSLCASLRAIVTDTSLSSDDIRDILRDILDQQQAVDTARIVPHEQRNGEGLPDLRVPTTPAPSMRLSVGHGGRLGWLHRHFYTPRTTTVLGATNRELSAFLRAMSAVLPSLMQAALPASSLRLSAAGNTCRLGSSSAGSTSMGTAWMWAGGRHRGVSGTL